MGCNACQSLDRWFVARHPIPLPKREAYAAHPNPGFWWQHNTFSLITPSELFLYQCVLSGYNPLHANLTSEAYVHTLDRLKISTKETSNLRFDALIEVVLIKRVYL